MDLKFVKLTQPTEEIAASFSKWENDPYLIPLSRPNQNQADLDRREDVTVEDLERRIRNTQLYLIYLNDQLVGEMDCQVDPPHLYKKEMPTAWIGIVIGEDAARGKGIEYQSIQFLEEEIRKQGLKRIELGVFEFNTNAIKLYQKLGYEEFARIPDFTFCQGKMWQDIRMEKYL